MKILIISQYYYPENFIINDVADSLKKRGNHIEVLTALPNYPRGRFFKGFNFFSKGTEIIKGVKINRSRIFPRLKGGKVSLSINYLSFVFFGLFKLLFLKGKFDKIFVFAPSPITVGIIGVLAAKKFKAKSYLWVQDLWPASVIEGGNIKNRFIINIIDFITKKIYKHSDYILVQSENFIQYIVDQGVDKRKITYLPNYAEEFYHRVKEDKTISNIFRGSFSITFAGNIGKSQNLEILVDAAHILKRKREQVKFVIIGTGRNKSKLLQKVKEFNIEDYFLFLGRKEAVTMPKYFKSSDVMLITLKKSKIFSYTIPSKLQAYMACEKPILGSIDGITQRIINESKSGFVSNAEEVNQLVENIIKLKYLDKYELEQLGKNSHIYYNNNFSKELVINKLIKIMSL